MKTSKILLKLTLILFIISCDDSQHQSILHIDENTNIASFSNGKLNIKELNNYIVNNSIKVHLTSDDLLKEYIKIIQNAVIEKQMLYESELAGIKELPEFKIKNRALRKKLFTQQYLKNKNINIQYTQNQLEAFYQDNINNYNLSEIRTVYHLFKSNESVNAKQEIESLRERVNSGESFKELASQYSDSETRHKQGLLGKIKQGHFSTELDQFIFNLPINEPSQVLNTHDGYHIFFVSEKLNEKNYELHEIKNVITRDFIADLTVKVIKEQAENLLDVMPVPIEIVTKNEFNKLISEKKFETELYKIDNESLLLKEFIYIVKEIVKDNPKFQLQDNLYKLFEENAYSEVIYQNMLKQGMAYNQQNLLNSMTSKLVLDEFSEIKLKSYINKNPDLITDYFEVNKLRYVTPIKLNIQVLSIPITEEINLMPVLEDSIALLNQNKLSLADLANQYNGKVITSGLMNKKLLSQFNVNINKFVSKLEINQYSPPFTANGFYTILKLIDKTISETNALPIVRAEVVKDYIANYKSQIFHQISQDYIKHIKINEEILEQYIGQLKL